jgi:hypothetical protein
MAAITTAKTIRNLFIFPFLSPFRVLLSFATRLSLSSSATRTPRAVPALSADGATTNCLAVSALSQWLG